MSRHPALGSPASRHFFLCVFLFFALSHVTPISSSPFPPFSSPLAAASCQARPLAVCAAHLLNSASRPCTPVQRWSIRESGRSSSSSARSSSSSALSDTPPSLGARLVSFSRKQLHGGSLPCARAVSVRWFPQAKLLPLCTLLHLHCLTTLLSFTALGLNALLSSQHLLLLPSLPFFWRRLLDKNNQLHAFIRGVITPDLPAVQATLTGPFFEELQFRFLLQKCLLSPLLSLVSFWLSVEGKRPLTFFRERPSPFLSADNGGEAKSRGRHAQATRQSYHCSPQRQETSRNRKHSTGTGAEHNNQSVDRARVSQRLGNALRRSRFSSEGERGAHKQKEVKTDTERLCASTKQEQFQGAQEPSPPSPCRVEERLRIAISSLLFAIAHYVPPSSSELDHLESRPPTSHIATPSHFQEPSGPRISSTSPLGSPSLSARTPHRSGLLSAPVDTRSVHGPFPSHRWRIADCIAANRILTAAVQGCVWGFAMERGGLASAVLLHVLHNLQQFALLSAFRWCVFRKQREAKKGSTP
ncbi:conserved hypothetical protein [Neospora caninum Liverpool]|uniref:CAAX protease self-immunity protein n=1 Tax=Neospora caninum (strain Liverpool) TaxID=572307 RepID=F0VEL4_NEOCL|nr:conserved hypothetical protein [Neospora caninum Liverpool]CBZ52158.1 conserved hypothetical protein [Neospora caninum Liverpool]CEL66122.1 TPA: hypothetical protein BN1204_019470 [Neospora caninum Liverpool]|eukprot:XP_003882190.1 conserved hypothetical protein [Neospora caninum Liverpool]